MVSLRQSQKTYYFELCHNVFTLRKATVPAYMESINFFIKTEIIEENTSLLFKRAGMQAGNLLNMTNILISHRNTCKIFNTLAPIEKYILGPMNSVLGPVTRKPMFINSFCFE